MHSLGSRLRVRASREQRASPEPMCVVSHRASCWAPGRSTTTCIYLMGLGLAWIPQDSLLGLFGCNILTVYSYTMNDLCFDRLVLHTYRCVSLWLRKRFRVSVTLPIPSSAVLPFSLPPPTTTTLDTRHPTHIHPSTTNATYPMNTPLPVRETGLNTPSQVCGSGRASIPRSRQWHAPSYPPRSRT